MSKYPEQEQKKQNLTVEQLLRLKRAEHPDAAFWDDFDKKLHQKLFQAAIEKRESRASRFFSALIHSRLTYAAVSAAAVGAVAFLAFSHTPERVSTPALAKTGPVDMVIAVQAPPQVTKTPISGGERYVVDRLNIAPEASGYTKVMAPQTLKISNGDSIRYVADPVDTTQHRVLYSSDSF